MAEAGSKPILVVDDNPDHRTIAAALLAHAGYDVLEADSAASAQELLEDHEPALVLLDIEMPDKNGLEWLRELRRDPRYADAKVLLYTAFDDLHQEELGRVQADGVLPKPMDASAFIAAVQHALRRAA